MTKMELSELIDNIKSKIDYYEMENINQRLVQLFLANGDVLKIIMPNNNIPHLLGVNTKYLESTGLFNGYHQEYTSYDTLKEMCNRKSFLIEQILSGHIREEQLFSKRIKEKLESFIENLKFNIFNIEFVCKYDNNINEENNCSFDYIVASRINSNYNILGLIKQNHGFYVPRSNQKVANENDEEKLNSIINKQEITYATSAKVEGYKDFQLYYFVKQKKLERLREISSKTKATINVSNDFAYILKKYQTLIEKGGFISDRYLTIILESIKQRKEITPLSLEISSLEELNPTIVSLIEEHNQILLNSKEIEILSKKEELEHLRQQLLEDKQKIKQLEEENKLLKNQNNIYNQTLDNITEQISRIRNK